MLLIVLSGVNTTRKGFIKMAKMWAFSPDSGGKKIPDTVKVNIQRRVEKVAEENYKGKYTRLDFRFRGQFCYIDAYTKSQFSEEKAPEWFNGTAEEYIRDVENTPTHLCRLRYFGDDTWSFSFYTYSNEKYELTLFADGNFMGKPEQAFLQSAIYLQD